MLEQSRTLKAAIPLFEWLLSPVLSDNDRAGCKNSGIRMAQLLHCRGILPRRVVRRIEKEHFVLFWFRAGVWSGTEKRLYTLRINVEAAGDSEACEIAMQHLERGGRVLDKRHSRRPATDRLNAYSARAGIQIKENGASAFSVQAR